MKSKLLLLIVTVGLFLTTPDTSAQSPPIAGQLDYDGLNVLFVIDMSGSTCGVRCQAPDYWGQGTDPFDLRFKAPQYALGWLRQFQKTVMGQNPVAVNMALIGFGDVQRLLLNWTAMDSITDADLPRLQEDISAQRFGETNLGNTDFYSSLEKARELFESAPPSQGKNNLRAIVLLTDGEPCPSDTCSDNDKREHLLVMQDFVGTYFQDAVLYVVVVDPQEMFYAKWQAEWNNVVCTNQAAGCDPTQRYTLATNPADVGNQFNRILAEIIGQLTSSVGRQSVAIPPGNFFVPPYQQYLRLNLFKTNNTPINNVVIRDPQGNSIPFNVSGADQPIQIHEILSPEPGQWTVEVDDPALVDEVQAVTDFISMGARVTVTPTSPSQTHLQMYTPATFTAQIVDSSNAPLPLYANNAYPLTMEVKLYDSTPNDPAARPLVTTIPLALDTVNAPGINQFIASPFLMTSGDYEVRLDAYYTDNNGQAQYILQDASMTAISISQSYVNWHGLDPISQRAGLPVILQADVLEKGSDLPLTGIEQMSFQVTVTAQDGTIVIDKQPLSNDPSAMPGTVLSTLQVYPPGQYNVNVDLGWTAPDGTFQVLESTPVALPLEIRPIQKLRILISRPADKSSSGAQEFPKFWETTPVTIQVEIRDENNNTVSLSSLTGGVENTPTITWKKDGDTKTITNRFKETTPGIYQAELTDMGRGSYRIEAKANTPALQLVGDYEWQTNISWVTHERQISRSLLAGGAGILSALGLLVIGSLAATARYRAHRKYPLQGTLVLKTRDQFGQEDILQSFDLTTYGVNKKTLKKKHLHPPFEYLVVSTHNDPQISNDRTLYIDAARIEGSAANRLTSTLALQPGEDRIIHTVTRPDIMVDYIVGNDTTGSIF